MGSPRNAFLDVVEEVSAVVAAVVAVAFASGSAVARAAVRSISRRGVSSFNLSSAGRSFTEVLVTEEA